MTSLSQQGHHHHSRNTMHNLSQSAAERNRAYYSSPDQVYLREKPFFDAFAAKWTEEFLAQEKWLDLIYPAPTSPATTPRNLKMLDYACGPGMAGFATLKLSPESATGAKMSFNPVIGVDIADGMVSLFNDRVASSQNDIPSQTTVKAYRGDFVSPAPSGMPNATMEQTVNQVDNHTSAPEVAFEDPEGLFTGFDLITCIAAVHHFEDPALAISRLVERLSDKGILFICDMVPGDISQAEDVWLGRKVASGDGHGHSHSHSHHHNHNHNHVHGHGQRHADAKDKNANSESDGVRPAEDTGLVHQGFTKAYTEDIFSKAGLVHVRTRLMDLKMTMPESFGGATRKMFWAIGRRA